MQSENSSQWTILEPLCYSSFVFATLVYDVIGYKFCWLIPQSRSTSWTRISWDTNWARINGIINSFINKNGGHQLTLPWVWDGDRKKNLYNWDGNRVRVTRPKPTHCHPYLLYLYILLQNCQREKLLVYYIYLEI